jgi:DNA-binding transcriptional MerR regulator
MKRLRVGELARRTGLTVRALHHWEEEGLIVPATRSESGYRLYGEAEVERLLRILALRQLGLSLAEVRDCLDRPEGSLARVVDRALARLDGELERQRRLRERLALLAERLRAADGASLDELLQTMEVLTMFEKYYDEGQLRQLAERGNALGAERTAADSPEAGGLARRWMGLVEEFTGGDAAVARSVGNLYQGEPGVRQKMGLDPEVMAWVQRAWAAEKARG